MVKKILNSCYSRKLLDEVNIEINCKPGRIEAMAIRLV